LHAFSASAAADDDKEASEGRMAEGVGVVLAEDATDEKELDRERVRARTVLMRRTLRNEEKERVSI